MGPYGSCHVLHVILIIILENEIDPFSIFTITG